MSATAAVAAMRRGEITAEDYANALLDWAEQWHDLNAFRTLRPDAQIPSHLGAEHTPFPYLLDRLELVLAAELIVT